MVENTTQAARLPRARFAFRYSRSMTRIVAVGGIIIGTLAIASPSWAGPLMGC